MIPHMRAACSICLVLTACGLLLEASASDLQLNTPIPLVIEGSRAECVPRCVPANSIVFREMNTHVSAIAERNTFERLRDSQRTLNRRLVLDEVLHEVNKDAVREIF